MLEGCAKGAEDLTPPVKTIGLEEVRDNPQPLLFCPREQYPPFHVKKARRLAYARGPLQNDQMTWPKEIAFPATSGVALGQGAPSGGSYLHNNSAQNSRVKGALCAQNNTAIQQRPLIFW